MGSRPLVSLGLPVYNGEKYLRRAIDSLLAQDYENLELIISDNASTDRTVEICQEYQLKDRRVHYYRNEKNMGGAWNFNRVLELARGEFFMWTADDDIWKPEFISSLFTELQNHPEAGVAMCATDVIGEDEQLIRTIRFNGRNNPNQFGSYRMLMGLTAWGRKFRKYNLFILGLYRKTLLQHAYRWYMRVAKGDTDRFLMCLVALATHFRYVDRILYVRTAYSLSPAQRYPEEKFSPMKTCSFDYFNLIYRYGQMLRRCDLIPAPRKLYIPLVMLRMGCGYTHGIIYRWRNKMIYRVKQNYPSTFQWIKKIYFLRNKTNRIAVFF
jgi:glycosyltransferase involved in cell wall biosynthesis